MTSGDARMNPGLRRLQSALMPDYNRAARLFWWIATLLGGATLVHCVQLLAQIPPASLAPALALAAAAMLTGLFPVRLPQSKHSFAAGEIFYFLLLMLHGPAAATLAAAGEGLIGACRTSRRWTSRIATPALAALAMFITGWTLENIALPLAHAAGLDDAGAAMAGMMACALLHFVVNTLLVAALPYLKRAAWPTLGDLVGQFGWIAVVYLGSASVACLLFLGVQRVGAGALTAAVPIIAMLLGTLHFHLRQQAADENARRLRIEAMEREAAAAARHLQEVAVRERRFHSAFSHASIGMALVSFDGVVLQANRALAGLVGLDDAAHLLGRPLAERIEGDAAALHDGLARLAARRIASYVAELPLRHSAGRKTWAVLHGSVFPEAEDEAPCLILQLQDITARRRAEAQMQHMAFHDSLTGLPNRRRFHDLLGEALAPAGGRPATPFAVMFLDLDRFKLVNDSLGHAAGDAFLVAVARRIREVLRPRDVVARLGGDEFAVLADGIAEAHEAVALAGRLLDALRSPVVLRGQDVVPSASIGIALSRVGYSGAADMLRDADTAMYKAKSGGRGRCAVFDSGLHDEVAGRLRLESDLRRAAAGHHLAVAYQPLFELAGGRLTGFEALARWDHPELGPVEPQLFIAVAEDAGLMTPLTDFVLQRACGDLRAWHERAGPCAALGMHVNVSGHDITHPGFLERVSHALRQAGLEARHLTLELTENILGERFDAALPALHALRRLGVGLSIDDFGTGNSSLRHLSSLPVNSLKIDRGFIAELPSGGNAAKVVLSIVRLGESLGQAVIAEGIETAAQAALLREMGCRAGQGFHLSRPLAAGAVRALLDRLDAAGRVAAPGLLPPAPMPMPLPAA